MYSPVEVCKNLVTILVLPLCGFTGFAIQVHSYPFTHNPLLIVYGSGLERPLPYWRESNSLCFTASIEPDTFLDFRWLIRVEIWSLHRACWHSQAAKCNGVVWACASDGGMRRVKKVKNEWTPRGGKSEKVKWPGMFWETCRCSK